MNTFITRWATALSVTAAAAIVLTAGAVNASNQSSPRLDPSAPLGTAVDLANDQLGGCPLGQILPGVDIDVSSSRPGDIGGTPAGDVVTPAGDGDTPDDGIVPDVGVDVGTSPDEVIVGSNGNAPDASTDPGIIVGVDTGSSDSPAAAAPVGDAGNGDSGAVGDGNSDGDVGTAPPAVPPAGDGTTGTADSGRSQLVDLDALLGSSGLSLDVPASDGSLADLGVGRPAADDPSTVALIDVAADANDVGATDVDVDGLDLDGGLVDGIGTGLIDTGLIDSGLIDTGLISLPAVDAVNGTDAGNGADVDATGLLGNGLVNANNAAAGHGDIGTVDTGTIQTGAPLVNVVAPVTADAGSLG